MSMLNRVMLRRSATLYGYENQASDLVRRLPFCEPKFPDQRAGIKAQRGSDATVTPRTRSRRRAARTYATQPRLGAPTAWIVCFLAPTHDAHDGSNSPDPNQD